MDETIAKWIIEYLLRKRIDDKIINGVISSLSPVINDDRIKKTMLLRRIEIETSNGCVSEQILELIEIIEALDHEKGKTASDLMKEAYCLVAVDCTVRFLSENVEENEKYMEKVEIVWSNRVCKSERLVSEKSKEWLGNIEAAASDSNAYGKIWMRNTRNEALKAVKDYLRESWECVGPCLIELVAVKAGNRVVEGVCGGNVVCSGNPCRELAAAVVEVKNRRNRVAKILVPDENAMNKDGDGTSGTVRPGDVTPKVDSTKEATTSCSVKQSVLSDHLSGDNQIAQTLSSTGNNSVVEGDHNGPELLKSREVARVQKTLEKNTRELHAAVSDHLSDDNPTAQTLSSTRNNSVVEANDSGPELLKSREVARVRKTLKKNTRALHPAVSDHLSDDNPTAQTLSSTENNSVLEANDNGPELLKSCEVARGEANHNGPELLKSREVARVRESLEKDTRELHPAVSDHPSDDNSPAQTSSSKGNNSVVEANHNGPELLKSREVARVRKAVKKSARELHVATSDLLSDDNKTAQTLSSTGNNNVVEANHNGPELLKSCEVARVRKALKKNTRELHAAVSDPLPEALRTAQTVVASMTTGSVLLTIPKTEREQNAQKLAQKMETDQAETETGAPQGAVENDSESLKRDVLDENSRGNVSFDHGVQKNVRKRSLMEANGTSHNYQGGDEIGNSSSGSPSRPRLPSPKPLNSSPMKIPENRNFQRRRERKRWVPVEEDTLREGVKKYGRGNWKAILNDVKFGEVFQGRTEVDLKDKWRNLTR